MTPTIIAAGFDHTGIYPFDKEKILDAARRNLGQPSTPSAAELTRFESATLFFSERIEEILRGQGENEGIEVVVQAEPGEMFDGEQILKRSQQTKRKLEFARQERQEKKTKRVAKKEYLDKLKDFKREHHTCRGDHGNDARPPIWRGGGAWLWCERCDAYGLCHKCKASCAEWLREHELSCEQNPPVPPTPPDEVLEN